MPRRIEEFLNDPSSEEKELTRKLYWSITSTFQVSSAEKRVIFNWAADLATRIAEKRTAAPPPASRFDAGDSKPAPVAPGRKRAYDGQAGGGAARGLNGRRRAVPSSPSQLRAGSATHSSLAAFPPQGYAAFLERQAGLKERALRHMHAQWEAGYV